MVKGLGSSTQSTSLSVSCEDGYKEGFVHANYSFLEQWSGTPPPLTPPFRHPLQPPPPFLLPSPPPPPPSLDAKKQCPSNPRTLCDAFALLTLICWF